MNKDHTEDLTERILLGAELLLRYANGDKDVAIKDAQKLYELYWSKELPNADLLLKGVKAAILSAKEKEDAQ